MIRLGRARATLNQHHAEALAARAPAPAQVRLVEAAGRQADDRNWRRLNDGARELPAVTGDRMREIAAYLYTYNPIARRIINLIGEWTVGEGVTFRVPHKRTQAYLDRHWSSRGAGWRRGLERRVRELWLFGDQAWPIFTNPHSGLFAIGYLDPGMVKEVISDPENSQMPIGLVVKGGHGIRERRYRTALVREDLQVISDYAAAERERFTDGETLWFTVNNLSNQRRGMSELFSLADSLDGFEQLMWMMLQQMRSRSATVWDVTLIGATKTEIDERIKDMQPPKPLSIRVHNDKEKWELVGPGAAAAAADDAALRVQRNHILGGAAVPEHWYGGGGDVNRATAAEMGAPTEKAMTARQREVEAVIEDVLLLQVDRGVEVGYLRDLAESRDITVDTPDLSSRDTSRIGSALAAVAAAFAQAGEEGWVDDETASRVLAGLVGQMGVRVDAQQMLERAREERGEDLADEASRALGGRPARQ